jgi:hypothetical protein
MAKYPTGEGCKLQDRVEDITSSVVGNYGQHCFLILNILTIAGDRYISSHENRLALAGENRYKMNRN